MSSHFIILVNAFRGFLVLIMFDHLLQLVFTSIYQASCILVPVTLWLPVTPAWKKVPGYAFCYLVIYTNTIQFGSSLVLIDIKYEDVMFYVSM